MVRRWTGAPVAGGYRSKKLGSVHAVGRYYPGKVPGVLTATLVETWKGTPSELDLRLIDQRTDR